MAGPLTTSLLGLWVSGVLPPGTGGPYKRAATLEPTLCFRELTHNSRAGKPKRLRPNCHSCPEVLSNQRGHCTQGRGPKDPSAFKGRDPRTLTSRRHWLLQVVAATSGGLWTAGEGRPTSASSTSLPSSSTHRLTVSSTLPTVPASGRLLTLGCITGHHSFLLAQLDLLRH